MIGDYIKRFQGLDILWREIDANVEPEYSLVTQIVEQIEDPLFSGPCESIKNWYKIKCTFRDAEATLRAHAISKTTSQTKRAIKNEVNRLLSGSSNKRRAIGEQKALRALRLGEHEDMKKSEDRVTLKVWKMMTTAARISMQSSEGINIGLVKYSSENTGKPGGMNIYQQHMNNCDKFLQLTQSEGEKNEAAYMKIVDKFIND